MTKYVLLLALAALLAACVSPPPQRPAALVQGERYLEMGVQSFRADDYAGAAHHFTQALNHYQGLDHQDGMLHSRINLAETALAVGNAAAAERHLQAARLLTGGEVNPRLQLLQSSAALRQGQQDVAVEILAPLLDGAPRRDALYRSALANRVDAALARGEADAAAWVERYAAALRGDDAPIFTARLYRFQGELARRGGDYSGAEGLLRQALDIYKAVPARPGTAAALEAWGALLVEQQRWQEAEDRYQRALHIRLWLLDRHDTAAGLRRLAAISEATGRPQRAAAQRRWAEIVAGDGRVDWVALQREVLPQ
jgi:tetratricopeptide (TPR) repeat protein